MRSAAVDGVLVLLAAIIVPQVVLRAASEGDNAVDIRIAAFACLAGLAVAYFGTTRTSRIAGGRQSHQVIKDYMGPNIAVVAAAAQFLCYVLLVMLGAGLVVSGLRIFVPLGTSLRFVLVALVLVLAVPVVLGFRVQSRLLWIVAGVGAAGLAAVLGAGLIEEMTGGLDVVSAISAREDVRRSGFDLREVWPRVSTVIVSLFPAALLVLLSERPVALVRDRRTPPRLTGRGFGLATIAIMLTLYLIVVLEMPGRRFGVPTLSMALAFFGEVGQALVAIVYIVVGCGAALAAYGRLPILLREMALAGILPRRLGSPDAVKPRLTIVGLTAVLAAAFSGTLLSTQAGVTVLIVCALVQFALTCLAIVQRSVGLLKESVDREERQRARRSKWAFLGLTGIAVAALGVIGLAERNWLLVALGTLTVPALMIFFFRRGMGRVERTLAVSDLSAGRRLPSRVHGVILVNVIDGPTLQAISYARSLRLSSLTALTVDFDPARTRRLKEDWKAAALPVDLTILGTPMAATRGHIVDFIHALRQRHSGDIVTVFYTKLLPAGVWGGYLMRRSVPKVIADLRHERGVILAEVPYLYDRSEERE